MNDSVKLGKSKDKKNKTVAKDTFTGVRSDVTAAARSALSDKNTEKQEPFLPYDIVGGSVPYLAGIEEEAVWNAAAQACGTEKVHFTYTVEDNKCWYIATPSSSLASHPNSWCPLAAALPGNSEFWDKETVYIYESDGLASALRWDSESGRLQIFIGPARTLLPKVQSMDANFVTINHDSAKPVAWTQRALKSENLSRLVAWSVVASGIIVSVIAIAYILTINFMSITIQPDLRKAEQRTRETTHNLMTMAAQTLQNESLKHMVRIQELLDVLGENDGTLLMYQVSNDGQTVTWEALVPQAFSQGGIPEISGAKPTGGLAEDGRVKIVGNR